MVTGSMNASLRKSKWTKHKKKNWKKIDITAVEDALDKQRLELRTGGPVADKSDSELFVVEKTAEGSKAVSTVAKPRKRLTVDKIISPDPDAVVPKSNRNAAKLRRQKKRLYLQLKKRMEQKSMPVSHNQNAEEEEEQVADLWDKEVDTIKSDLFKKTKFMKHTESVRRQNQSKRPAHMFKKSPFDVKPVEVSHPGASYNPTFNDHQDLLSKEHDRELTKVKKAEKIERALKFDPNNIATEESTRAEMEEGLFDEEKSDSGNSEGNASEEETKTVPVKTAAKKTKRKRKNEMKERMEKRIKLAKKAKNRRENEVYRIKSILKEITREEEKRELKKVKRDAVVRRPMLSNTKYKEPDHDLKLSDEIKGTLRQLKPEGSVMFDRFKSFQRRCILAPHDKSKAKRRKPKVKHYEKPSFREIEL